MERNDIFWKQISTCNDPITFPSPVRWLGMGWYNNLWIYSIINLLSVLSCRTYSQSLATLKRVSWCLPVAGHAQERAFQQQRSSVSVVLWWLTEKLNIGHSLSPLLNWFFFFASSDNSPYAIGNVLFKLICLLVFTKTQYPAAWKTQKYLLCYFAFSPGIWHF